jgi:hypothetical protein
MSHAWSHISSLQLDVDKRAALSHGEPRICSSLRLLMAPAGQAVFLACRWRLDAALIWHARRGLAPRPTDHPCGASMGTLTVTHKQPLNFFFCFERSPSNLLNDLML